MTQARRPHVLIVSDDLELTAFLSEGLMYAGFWSSVIASSLQALEVLRLRSFDLILIDAALEGLGARELIRRYLGQDRGGSTGRPVLAIASNATEMEETEAYTLGLTAILYAPIEIEDLAGALFLIVQEWRRINPGEPWADDAAQAR